MELDNSYVLQIYNNIFILNVEIYASIMYIDSELGIICLRLVREILLKYN